MHGPPYTFIFTWSWVFYVCSPFNSLNFIDLYQWFVSLLPFTRKVSPWFTYKWLIWQDNRYLMHEHQFFLLYTFNVHCFSSSSSFYPRCCFVIVTYGSFHKQKEPHAELVTWCITTWKSSPSQSTSLTFLPVLCCSRCFVLSSSSSFSSHSLIVTACALELNKEPCMDEVG